MIRLDGYYVTDYKSFDDSLANYSNKGYFHNAYQFLSNGKYLKAVKKTQTRRVKFTKLDFDPNFENNYKINGSVLKITFHSGEKWEFSEQFEIISESILRSSEKTLHFIEWGE